HTRMQIVAYAVLLAPLGLAPYFTGLGGPLYGVVAALGGTAFVGLSARLALSKAGDDGASLAPARLMFGYSIFYLFALFAALLSEQAWPQGPSRKPISNIFSASCQSMTFSRRWSSSP